MTLDEDLAKRIAEDAVLSRVLAKADSGTADFTDTSRYHDRMAEIVGAVMREYVLDVPLSERSAFCERVLRDRYRDSAELLSRVQEALDASLGIRLAPQIPEFQTERVQKIGHSLEDATAPDEKIQRRAESASANVVRAFQDRYVQKNARFRSDAGLKCWIVRDAGAKCCDWCAGIDGKYEYGSEPKDVYGRHDNCTCTVTYENGKRRQDVWSKRTWEQPAPDAGAGEAVRFSMESMPSGAGELVRLRAEEAGQLNLLGKLKSLFPGQPYRARVTEFTEQLASIPNRNVVIILRGALETTQFAQSADRHSVYRDGKVYLSKSATLSTIAHELFHSIDARNGITKRGWLDNCLITDYERLKKLCESTGQTLGEMLYLKHKNAFLRHGKLKPDYRGISDILEGMTNGETRLGYGHIASNPEYWKKHGALSRETFAQYGRMYFEENPAVFDMLKELFPDTTAQIDAIISAIAQFGR